VETPSLNSTPDLANAPVELLNVSVSDIEFGDRARKNYKDLALLAEDFRKRGVIQPIAVKHQPPGSTKPFFLLAGGRRFSAAVFAQIQTIPCRVYPDYLSELDTREIELMENVQRADLTWPEEVWLTEQIHRLQVERFGVAAGPSAGHSAADTAKILQVSPMSVSRDRYLARGLEKYGDTLKRLAKTKSEALRTLKRLERHDHDKKVAKKFEETVAEKGDDYVRRVLVNEYICGDFFEGVPVVPASNFQLIEVDPPYGIDLHHVKRGAERMHGNYTEVADADYPMFLERLFTECFRVAFPISWIIVWCSWQWRDTVGEKLEAAGFSPRPAPAIWYKLNFAGQTHNPDFTLASCYETFIYASKGSATLRRPGHSNVFPFKPLFSEDKSHSTERPVELLTEIIDTFIAPNDRVLVPFLGSGNTLLAVNNAGCSGVGWEIHGDVFKPTFTRKVMEGKLKEFKSYGPKDTPYQDVTERMK